ncbi:unnamed protein product, partial [Mesorhabditis belari]|uniref:Protein kinase domain-containing protein n=1 Tax=Mesorhabditis belari TaxID=2138241 RepID=A0AAF3ESH3_9BILA
MEQLASVLVYLKQKELVHRDLKPANIMMFNKHREIRVCDFGISAWEDTFVGRGGTIRFAAPNPLHHLADHRDDVYSVGMILWQLVFKAFPFIDHNAENPAVDTDDLWERVGNGERLPLDETHPAIREVIESCWAHEKDDRLTAEELHETMLDWKRKIQRTTQGIKSPSLFRDINPLIRPHGTFPCTHPTSAANYQRIQNLGFCVPRYVNLIQIPNTNQDYFLERAMRVVYNRVTREAHIVAENKKTWFHDLRILFGQLLRDVDELPMLPSFIHGEYLLLFYPTSLDFFEDLVSFFSS